MKNKFYHLSRFMLILMTLSFTTTFLSAQVAINNDGSAPDNSAMLDVKSSNKGLLIPRLTTTQRTSLTTTAVAGLMVYDTDINKFFFFNGSIWQEGSVGNLWSKSGSYTYLSNTNDNVGIGTTAPYTKIDAHVASGPSFVRVKSDDAYAGIMIDKGNATDNAYILYRTGSTNYWSVGMIGDNNFNISTSYSSSDSKFFINSSGQVGIGTTSPARTFEVVSSDWKSARISSTTYPGAFLEFMGTNTTNWAFGTYSGSARLLSTVDGFTNITDEYWFSTSAFYPYTNNARTLGTAGKRWSTLYSGIGNFSSAGSGIAGATVYSANTGSAGIAGYFESNGSDATMVLKQNGTGYFLKGFGPDGGNEEWAVHDDGYMEFFNSNHNRTISIDPSETGSADAGQITMYSADGLTSTIEIDGGWGGPNGRITTNELQITGGSDLSEYFDLTQKESIKEGMVVSIDENNPGHLTVSQYAYDKKVAGIVSGANSIKPGLMMSQKGTIADGEHLIALSGRVYCLADATKDPIEIGDLLTTSDIPGHAMKVTDFENARGAIIGKAMTSLKSGKGLVLVLVSLQ